MRPFGRTNRNGPSDEGIAGAVGIKRTKRRALRTVFVRTSPFVCPRLHPVQPVSTNQLDFCIAIHLGQTFNTFALENF